MIPLAIISNLFSGDGLIIFLILLLLFGAKKLPELARGLGSAVREFSKAKDEIHHEMTRPPVSSHPQIESPKHTEPHYADSGDMYDTSHYSGTSSHGTVTAEPEVVTVPPATEPSPMPVNPSATAATVAPASPVAPVTQEPNKQAV